MMMEQTPRMSPNLIAENPIQMMSMDPRLKSSSLSRRIAAEMMKHQRKSSPTTQTQISMSIQIETPMRALSAAKLVKQRDQNAKTMKRRFWSTHLQSKWIKDAKSMKVNLSIHFSNKECAKASSHLINIRSYALYAFTK